MELRLTIVSILSSLLLTFVVIDFVRRRKMKEEYSLLWIGASIIFLIVSVWRPIIDSLAHLIGISYGPSALFMIIIFFIILFLLHVSIVLSKLTEQNKTLVQRVALLEHRLKNVENSTNLGGSDGGK